MITRPFLDFDVFEISRQCNDKKLMACAMFNTYQNPNKQYKHHNLCNGDMFRQCSIQFRDSYFLGPGRLGDKMPSLPDREVFPRMAAFPLSPVAECCSHMLTQKLMQKPSSFHLCSN